MRYKLATTCFVIGSVLAPFAAHAADGDADRSKPVTFVKDSVITTKIKAKLAAEHLASAKHTQAEANRAVQIARDTEGVKSVNTKLKVQKDR